MLKIALTCTSKTQMLAEIQARGLPCSDDTLEEYDSDETIAAIAKSLSANGDSVRVFGWGNALLGALVKYPPDVVFNIAEGLGGRAREAQVPAMLEMLGVPYVGSDPLTLAMALDKNAAKAAVKTAGVHVPKGFVIRTKSEILSKRKDVVYPVVLKPCFEGSSRGVHHDSIAYDDRAYRLKVASLLDAYAQPVLVEEFIDGPEVTVGVVGDPPRVLGVMEIAPKRKFAWSLYSIEVKRNFEELVEYRCPPALSPAVVRRVEKAALTAFETLGCKDMARIDFRLRPPGQPVFLEINPLPGLNPESSDLCIMAKLLGVSHADLVQEILGGALARYGLRSNQAPQESAVR